MSFHRSAPQSDDCPRSGTAYPQADFSTAPMTVEDMNCLMAQLALDNPSNRDYTAPQHFYAYSNVKDRALGTNDTPPVNISEVI